MIDYFCEKSPALPFDNFRSCETWIHLPLRPRRPLHNLLRPLKWSCRSKIILWPLRVKRSCKRPPWGIGSIYAVLGINTLDLCFDNWCWKPFFRYITKLVEFFFVFTFCVVGSLAELLFSHLSTRGTWGFHGRKCSVRCHCRVAFVWWTSDNASVSGSLC